jgi:LysM repeat protein
VNGMRTARYWSRITGIVVLLTLVLAPAAPVAAESGPATLGAQAERAWSNADWPAALAILEHMRSLAPADHTLIDRQQRGHLNYAWDLLSAGNGAEANAQFGRALGLLPEDPEALQGLDLIRQRCPAEAPIRAPSTAGSVAQPVNRPTEYRVLGGDTLYSIARRYGVTANAIRRTSDLESEDIRAGMTLTIPPLTTTSGTRRHTVRAGDTLYSLARAYGSTVLGIQRANGLTGTAIRTGAVLTIPAANPAQTHIVRRGETLYSIAGHYGTTVGALHDANGLTGSDIVPGMVLVIP